MLIYDFYPYQSNALFHANTIRELIHLTLYSQQLLHMYQYLLVFMLLYGS